MKRSKFKLCGLLFLFSASSAGAATHHVQKGESIQAAIKAAQAGDTITVAPGVYKESVFIDKENITLQGQIVEGAWPEIAGSHKLNDGIIASGSGFTVENILIRDFKGNGITTQAANNVIMRRIIVRDTGIYGIYPTLGQNILIEDTISSGIEDAAIYVGMCSHVDVRRNVTYENVAGIEIENSQHVLVENNKVHDNAGGILVFTLPGLPVKFTKDVIVRRNFVFNNNHHNFAAPGSVVGGVPPGSGIIILAGDEVVIEDNIVENNSLAGVIIADHDLMPNMTLDPKTDPTSEDISIRRNTYSNNGTKGSDFVISWIRFVVKSALAEDAPEGVDSAAWPEPHEIYHAGSGKGICYDPRDGPRVFNKDKLTICDPALTTDDIRTKISTEEIKEEKVDAGKKMFAAVCAGCHAVGVRAVGPPVEEVQKKYKDNLNGIVAYALNPKKVRSDYPDMPSQQHLGEETLKAVAKYFLELK